MQSEPGLSSIHVNLEFIRLAPGCFGCCGIPNFWERAALFAQPKESRPWGTPSVQRRKAPPVVLPKLEGNWGFLYIVKRLRAVSFVLPYHSRHTFLALAFQTTDGSHLESLGFLYRSSSMWNGFSEPDQFRQTKDAANLILLCSSFSVECLRKGLMHSPRGARARTSLRSGLCCFCITHACTSPWKKLRNEPGNPIVSCFSHMWEMWPGLWCRGASEHQSYQIRPLF